jgi:phosphoglycerate kinase
MWSKHHVDFAPDCVGEIAEKAVAAMKDGEILCLENTRFHAGEEKNDPAFVAQLAKLGDIWVNDAFSCAHRAHASTEGLGRVLPVTPAAPWKRNSKRSVKRWTIRIR